MNNTFLGHKKGKIYVVTTPSRELYHIYRVGASSDIRTQMELFNAKQPANDQFKCVFLRDCSKINVCENLIKQQLEPFRIIKAPNTKFLRVNLDHIKEVINKHIDVCEKIGALLANYHDDHTILNEEVAPEIDISV